MDFIEGLPTSGFYNSIMVLADRLCKYAHFFHLTHSFTAQSVADKFSKTPRCTKVHHYEQRRGLHQSVLENIIEPTRYSPSNEFLISPTG